MKKIISGIIIGGMIFMGTSALADGLTNLVGKKVQSQSTVEIGGKLIDTVVVEGKNYAPVRELGEAAGFKVGTDGKKVTLIKPEIPEYTAIKEKQRVEKIESLKKAIAYSNEQLDIMLKEVERLKTLQSEQHLKPYDNFDYDKGIKNAELQVTQQQELIKKQEGQLSDLDPQ